MSAYRHEQESVVVATAPTQTQAELVKTTLVAHGFDALVGPASSAYPSIDFVEGISITVRPEDEERARDLLTSLGIDDGRRS